MHYVKYRQLFIRLCAVLVLGSAPVRILNQVQGKSGINTECGGSRSSIMVGPIIRAGSAFRQIHHEDSKYITEAEP